MINLSALPEKVPAHFNAAGEVDRFGPKVEMIILPIVGAFVAGLMQWIERFPEKHNYPQRLNENNVKEFYLVSRKNDESFKKYLFTFFCFKFI